MYLFLSFSSVLFLYPTKANLRYIPVQKVAILVYMHIQKMFKVKVSTFNTYDNH